MERCGKGREHSAANEGEFCLKQKCPKRIKGGHNICVRNILIHCRGWMCMLLLRRELDSSDFVLYF